MSQDPIEGRPNVGTPEFIMSCPGWWLKASVCMERISAMSSTQPATWGSRLETSVPHWPCFWNFTPVPFSTAVSLRMNANLTSSRSDSGMGCPSSSLSFGLGSKRSIWLGAPAMNKKMQALARGAKWGGLGALGFTSSRLGEASSRPSRASAAVSAIPPRPLAEEVRKSRRDWRIFLVSGSMITLALETRPGSESCDRRQPMRRSRSRKGCPAGAIVRTVPRPRDCSQRRLDTL